jgi:hypothetical protein
MAAGQAKGAARSAAETGKQAGKQAAGNVDSDLLLKVGRVGVVGLGVVYLLLAFIAAQVALGGGSGGESADNTGALQQLSGNAFGKIVLGILVVGFAAYAIWQWFEAATGFHRYEGDGNKRTVKRVFAVIKGLIGAGLGISSFRILTSGSQQSSSDKQADLTAKLMEAPAGRYLVMLVGLVIIAYAANLVVRGVKKKFLEKLEGYPGKRIEQLGVAGYVARGIAFGVLGILVVVAGIQSDPEEARGLDAALKTLAEQPFGTVLLLLVALGFAAYGVYELLTARRAREG